MTPNKDKRHLSINVSERFPWATKEQQEQILSECDFQYKLGLEDARSDLIERYKAGQESVFKAIRLLMDDTK